MVVLPLLLLVQMPLQFNAAFAGKLHTHLAKISTQEKSILNLFAEVVDENEEGKSLFKLERKIGEGSFGKVYLFERRGDSLPFAAKIIALQAHHDEKNPQHTLCSTRIIKEWTPFNEIACQQRCCHPEIMPIESIHVSNNQDYLLAISPFVSGGDLDRLIRKQEALCVREGESAYFSEDFIKIVVKQLAHALHYLHADLNIVHRDIKSKNVLISEDHKVKLIDFGFAEDLSNSSAGEYFYLRGTPRVIAPELWLNPREIPIRYLKPADMWALGVLLYELVNLAPAYNGNNIREMSNQVLNQDPPLPLRLLSEELTSLLYGLLDKDPRQRLSSEEVVDHPFLSEP
jgi:serine/threonine protein kinase